MADPRLKRAGVAGFNKPKRTPSHPKKSHIVVAKADYEGIADQIERSKRLWENISMDGLVKRREEEADLILNSII